MNSIVAKSLLYLIIVVSIAYGIGLLLNIVTVERSFQPGSTHSVMLVLKEPQHYDIVVLGSSHARITLDKLNHTMYEERLGKSIANISYHGSGVVPIGVMSDYFFKEGNTCQTAIYFIDAFIFYSDHFNEDNKFLTNEPFTPGLLSLAIQWGVTPNKLFTYYQSKYRTDWLLHKPVKLEPITNTVETIDTQKIRQRLENMYPDGLNQEIAKDYEAILRDVISMYKQNSCNLYFVIPPTLLGKLPGQERLLMFLEKLKQEEGIQFMDLSQAITDPSLYKDHDHLNTRGSTVFLDKYFKPLVDSMHTKGAL